MSPRSFTGQVSNDFGITYYNILLLFFGHVANVEKKFIMLDPFKIILTQICHPMPIFQSHSPKSIVRHVYKERYQKCQHLFGSKTCRLFSTASKVHRTHAQNTLLVDDSPLKNLLNLLELLPHPLTDQLLHQ